MPGFLLVFNLAFLGEQIVTLKNTFLGHPVYFIRSLRNSIRQREGSLLLCISSVLLPGKFYQFQHFYIYIIYFAWVFVCLHPINVKTAKPHITPRKGYECSKFCKGIEFLSQTLIFLSIYLCI